MEFFTLRGIKGDLALSLQLSRQEEEQSHNLQGKKKKLHFIFNNKTNPSHARAHLLFPIRN